MRQSLVGRGSAIVILFAAALGAAALGGCGSKHSSDTADAGTPDARTKCGNSVVEAGEECDDGDKVTDIVCDSTCHFTCGNGTVDTDVGELCDSGIASGPGSCPTACDDGMACTTDVLSGTGCEAECINQPITDTVSGDGCCPTGATSLTDSDCSVMCGNGVVEDGETCDTAITSGDGACPTSCDDSVACTTDTLLSGGTCQAACMHTDITMAKDDDGCCPTGANSGNDNDCSPSCGNGVVDNGETCDTGIASGTGSCPTSCSDGMACTTDTLVSGGTCQAACNFPPITMPKNGDGCCPPGANANNDDDCQPVCGNKVVENGEDCDDGNTDPNDGCDMCKTVALPPTAFRFTDLDLRDPHVFVNFIACNDVTDTQLAGFAVNSKFQDSITMDTDGDGLLDFSPTIVFRPLDQSAGTSDVEIHIADCTAPMAGTSCTAGAGSTAMATATNMSGTQCLDALAGTTHGYSPAITPTSAPCFVTSPVTLTITVADIPITLHDARIAATYVGNPATTLANGLLMGFMSETDADNTTLPSSLPLVGGHPLSELLAGGKNSCPKYSDMDTDNGVTGWWFYLNFPAAKVTWTD